jgi:hypothetical protein
MIIGMGRTGIGSKSGYLFFYLLKPDLRDLDPVTGRFPQKIMAEKKCNLKTRNHFHETFSLRTFFDDADQRRFC